jgi:hypothetical protein
MKLWCFVTVFHLYQISMPLELLVPMHGVRCCSYSCRDVNAGLAAVGAPAAVEDEDDDFFLDRAGFFGWSITFNCNSTGRATTGVRMCTATNTTIVVKVD